MTPQSRIRFPVVAAVLLLLCAFGGAVLWATRAGDAAATGNLVGADVGGAFTLVNGDGRTVTDRDFAGRYRLIYFGYTYCPDVCPTDMQRITQGLKMFEAGDPARAAKVAPIFITIDPARDTPAAVKQFAAAFHPRLVGLTGSAAQVEATLKAFRVYAAKRGKGDNYLMDHSAMVYLFGPDGRPISFLAQPSPAQVAADLDRYVA